MEPLFNKICDEAKYATKQLNNHIKKQLKDDNKWFQTMIDVILML